MELRDALGNRLRSRANHHGKLGREEAASTILTVSRKFDQARKGYLMLDAIEVFSDRRAERRAAKSTSTN